MGDVRFGFDFVFSFGGVGDECVGGCVVDEGDVIEVVDEGFDFFFVVCEGDCGFDGVGGVFVHTFIMLRSWRFVKQY